MGGNRDFCYAELRFRRSSVDLPSLPFRGFVRIRLELAAPVAVPDNRPGTAAHEIDVAPRRITTADVEDIAAQRLMKPAVGADGDDFFLLIH